MHVALVFVIRLRVKIVQVHECHSRHFDGHVRNVFRFMLATQFVVPLVFFGCLKLKKLTLTARHTRRILRQCLLRWARFWGRNESFFTLVISLTREILRDRLWPQLIP